VAEPSRPSEEAIVLRLRAAGCVFAEDEARLLVEAAKTPAELEDLVERRVGGIPLEYLLGWVEFCGLRIGIDPGVFVPRQRTEFLVREAARFARPGSVVLDLCCGSGALGVALASLVDGIELYAADIEPAAVRCAERNVAAARGQVFEGDLFEPLPAALRGTIDILLANVPYVPTDAIALMPPEAREHEPFVTLNGGADGLDVLRQVAAGATEWLAPGGSLFVETSEEQAPSAAVVMAEAGLVSRVAESEEYYATVVIGTLVVGTLR
jgi:release factor glutamine methyltransferase